MHRVVGITLFQASLCCGGAFAQTVNFDIIIAQNVDRGRNHYIAAASEANRILQRCAGLTAELAGVRRFTNSIGVAPIAEESTRVAARTAATTNGANVLVVNDLRVCDTVRETPGSRTNVVGCAGQGSALTIETSRDPLQEGRIIAHELGHSSKLMRDLIGQAHAPDSGFLMFKAIEMSVALPTIDDDQCNFFRNAPNRFQGPSGVVGPEAVILADADADADANADAAGSAGSSDAIPVITSDLDQLLEQVWLEGAPFAELDELMAADDALPKLRMEVVGGSDLLKRTNSAVVLGRYGTPGDIQILRGALKISRPGDDSAELQRFSSAVIGSIAELGIRHEDESAAEVIRTILAEVTSGTATSLPATGLDRSAEIDLMSSAATTALEAAPALEKAGLIISPEALLGGEALVEGVSGLPDSAHARGVLMDSPLNLDPNFVARIFGE